MAIVLTDLPLSPIVLLVVILTIYVVVYATYNLFLHPLARVPGPFLAHLTSTWLQFYDLAGVRVYMIDDLHQRFGPVVRVAPNELSFADPSMIKEIYGQASPYMKSAMYSLLSVGPHLGVFDTADREVHKKRRRLISHVFAATSVNACEPVIADLIRHLLRWIKKESESIPPRPVDVFVWFRMLTLDVAGALFFGTSFNALASGKIHPYLEDIDNHFVIAGIRWQLPYFLPLTSWLPISSWQYFLKTRQRLYDYGRATFDEYISRYGRSPASNRIDLLKKIINSSDEKGVVSLTDEEIISEVGIFMLGGTDTTSIVLTYTLWELARQPLWQNKLREELKEHVIFNDGVPSWQQVQNLKILDAVITEGLRLHPAVPGGLPRVAPKEGVRMSGFWVPGGTAVSMSAWTLHHNSAIYHSPTAFQPRRWLEPDSPEHLIAMRDSFFTWSRGSRVCVGMHLAITELKLTISALVRGWKIEVAEGTTEQGMEAEDHFAGIPKAKSCQLNFVPVSGET